MSDGERPDLESLLAPTSLEEFFERHWERRPLIATRGGDAGWASLLEVGDVEFLTGSLERLDAKWIRLVDTRGKGRTREFQRPGGGLSMERILEAYREGTTVVLNDLQQRWPAIRDLARGLWRDFNDVAGVPLRAVGANAYLSPPNAQGLPVHFDSHCVLVLQLSGRKAWTLYDAREELPSPDGRDLTAAAWRGPESLAALDEVVLEPGDVVYLPRGLAHEARTADSHSLHLAVGLYPYTWGDAVAHAQRTVPELRRSLPRGILAGGEPSAAAIDAFSDAVEALREGATAAAALGPIRAEIERRRRQIRDDRFHRHHAVEAIDGDSRVVRTDEAPPRLRRSGETVLLELGGKSPIQAPAAAEPALRFIASHRSFTVSSLPDVLSDSSKRVLVRRLLKEGVLELAAPPSPIPAQPSAGPSPPTEPTTGRERA